jgi:hypothetical protein
MSGDVSNEVQILQWWDPDTGGWVDSRTARVTGMSLADAWAEADECAGFGMQYRVAVRRTEAVSTIAAPRPEPELKWEEGKRYHLSARPRGGSFIVTSVDTDGYGIACSSEYGRYLVTPQDRRIYGYVEAESDE